MSAPLRTLTIWCVTALFAAATGVGEGWHLVPGTGHIVEYPGGYRFYLGDAGRDARAYAGGPAGIEQQGQLPSRGADYCSICALTGQAKVAPLAIVSAAPCLQTASPPPLAPLSVCLRLGQPFRARAPPRAF